MVAGDITVIVKKNKQSTQGVPSLSYFSGHEKIYYAVNNVGRNDTVLISSGLSLFQISYFHSNQISYSYFACNGDTLTIDFVDDLPVATNTSHSWGKLDYSWQTKFDKEKSLLDGKTEMFYLFYYRGADVEQKTKVFWHNNYLEYDNKLAYIDSLYGEGALSSTSCKLQKISICLDKVNFWNDPFLSKYRDNNFVQPVTLSDSFLVLKNYRLYLEGRVKLNTGFYKDMQNYSYKKGFDWIVADTSVKGKSRDYLLFDFLKSVNSYCSAKDFEEACALFRKTVTDSTYLTLLEDVALTELKKQTVGLPNELKLSDKGKVAMSLSALLKKHRGKTIYVDFWASWCAPCRASMEAAAKLRKEYAEKNVVFVYLSMDSNFSAWQKAVASDLSANYMYSYLVVNPKQAKFIKDNQIKSIPRYLLYDKQGRLVYNNAPGPEGDAIRKELDRMLKE